jgi:hypothetical protein
MFSRLKKLSAAKRLWLIVALVVVLIGVIIAVVVIVHSYSADGTDSRVSAQKVAQTPDQADSTTKKRTYAQILQAEVDAGHIHTALGKQVVADGKISVEELHAVKAAFIQCMANAGYDQVVANDDGSGSVVLGKPATGSPNAQESEDLSAKEQAADSACGASSDWGLVDGYYMEMFENPNQVSDPVELQYECQLHYKVFTQDEVSLSEFKKILSQPPSDWPSAWTGNKDFRHCNQDMYAPGTW